MGSTVPELIVKILVSAGYDNAISIAAFDESDLTIVQDYANKNLKELVKQFEVYSSIEEFEFLPGHKKLLFSLANKAKDYLDQKSKKKDIKNNSEETESSVVEKTQLKDEEKSVLKTKLLSKINKFVRKVRLEAVYTENELNNEIEPYNGQSRTSTKKLPLRCAVKCILCELSISCTFNGYWQIGNLEKHIQKHVNRGQLTLVDTVDNSSGTEANNSSVGTTNNDNLCENSNKEKQVHESQNTSKTCISNIGISDNQVLLNECTGINNDVGGRKSTVNDTNNNSANIIFKRTLEPKNNKELDEVLGLDEIEKALERVDKNIC